MRASFLVASLSVVWAGSAFGETIYVDTHATGPVHDGSSWCDAYLHLQDALAAAAASSGSIDEIRVADGVYTPDQGAAQTPGNRDATFQLINDVTIAGGYAGCGAPNPNDRDIAAYETILSGDLTGNDAEVPVEDLLDEPTRAENSQHVVTGSGTDETATLDGCTLAGGNATEYPYPLGGGIYNANGNPTVTRCTFRKNAAEFGGGVYNADASPTLIGCTFDRNRAQYGGGGIANRRNNPTISHCTFRNNSANRGAGVDNRRSTSNLTNCTFDGNSAEANGGGMYSDEGSTSVTNCTFIGNTAMALGGALYNWSGSPTVTNSILWRNFPQEIYDRSTSSIVTYSNVRGGHAGVGNIAIDPRFVDAAGGDWRLRSESPCIDAGDNDAVQVDVETDLAGSPRFADHACADDVGNPGDPAGPIVDMGAHEFQDAPTCGDGLCDDGERCETCACDCGSCCGDGVCADNEDCLSCVDDCSCETIYVPDDYATIQAAIDAAHNGDDIVVGPGTYYEAIDFLGKAIALRSSDGRDVTTIDASGLESSVVTCARGEGADTSLHGFTITGGDAYTGGGMRNIGSSPTVTHCTFTGNSASYRGGAIYNAFSSGPTVAHCTLSGNSARFGGGMHNDNSNPTVTDCTFTRNEASRAGGGMRNNNASPTVIRCTFSENSATCLECLGGGMANGWDSSPIVRHCTFTDNAADYGGGMYNRYSSNPVVSNCLFVRNTAERHGGGMRNNQASTPTVTNCTFSGNIANGNGGGFGNLSSDPVVANCILWGNFPHEVFDDESSSTVTYSNVRGGHAGVGNIAVDPMFLDEAGDDWGLRSESPCVDSGDNDAAAPGVETDLAGEPRFSDHACANDVGNQGSLPGPIVDMGAYELPDRGGCGNGVCTPRETCETCACDCGSCCGDETCATFEDCASCSDDCPCETIYVPDDYATIQAAIDAAHEGDEIVVAPGTYFEAIDFLGKALLLRSADGAETTTIDATGLERSVVTCVLGEDADTSLHGFTITGGAATNGGGMHNAGSSPTVTDCTFSGNRASSSGGGMYNGYGTPTVTNCSFTENSAEYEGGGMFNDDCMPTITGSRFTSNRANWNGAGMFNSNSTATVTLCTFNGNSAGADGGGMYNWRSSPTITRCKFAGNAAEVNGGGMYNLEGDPTLTNCTFGNNWAWRGGGMSSDESRPLMTNCTFAGNSAVDAGGAVYDDYGSQTTATNCIIWDNRPDGVFDASVNSPAISYSNVQGGFEGIGNIDRDPMFVDAARNGWRLRSGSPCIDSADNDAVEEGVSTDLGGEPRFADHACAEDTGNGSGAIVDMGAYEFQHAPTCGDGICNGEESCATCVCDCGECTCGDGVCSSHEDCFTCSEDCACETLQVPEDYARIQDAIDASHDGDEILVAPGIYYEAIDLLGKAITLRSSDGREATTIDATGLETSVVKCVRGEGPDTTLEGFTITGGASWAGGGMRNVNSSPTIAKCTFKRNSAVYSGGAMNNSRSSPTVDRCRFSENTAQRGGGMSNWNSSPTLTNCTWTKNLADQGGGLFNYGSHASVTNSTFYENSAGEGGGVYNWYSDLLVTNSTFNRNASDALGGGMYNDSSDPTIANCIIWGNFPTEISNTSSSPTITYSNTRHGAPGTGNISTDPLFLEATNGDLRLRSGSPSIDAGDNDAVPIDVATDLAGDPRLADHACAEDVGNPGALPGPVVDMGAYEFQELGVCGDGVCSTEETCEMCVCDCGDCCGDGICASYEDCAACVIDCDCETLFVPDDYESIQAAIEASRDGDEIIVAPGTYYEAIDFLGRAITLRSSHGPDTTIIDASGLEESVVRCVRRESRDTTLEGFTLTGGNASDGGGLFLSYSNLTVNHCTITGNAADDAGGGIYNFHGFPALDNCTIVENSARNGGGMYNRSGNPKLTNCTFIGNSAQTGGGMNNSLANPTVANCTFSGNSASCGGGMANTNSSPTVTNCTFIRNSAHCGGGMDNWSARPLVTHCTFSGNSAGAYGGGIYNRRSDSTVRDCVFSGNFARISGGGMRNSQSSTTLTHCTFAENSSDGEGGGMFNANSVHPTLTNCILWGNLPQQIANENSSPTIVYSNVEGSYVGVGNIDGDPLFMRNPDPGSDGVRGTEDDDYGDLRLRPGSPCIDTGDPTFTPEPGATDLDGRARVLCDRVDMGAFEFAGDYDCNRTLDLRDVAGLQNCFTGEDAGHHGSGCETIDLNGDGSVDLSDLATFEWIMTGP